MPLIRANALRSFQSTLRSSATRAAPRARTQLVTRRFASSGGHGHGEPSSDLPWAIGAVVVTIPSCWYLWPEESTGHHGGHDSHGEEHSEEHEEEKEEEDAPADDAEEKSDEKEEVKEESSEDKEDKSDDKEEKSEEKSEEESEDEKEEKSEEKSEDKEEKSEEKKDEKSEDKEEKSEEKGQVKTGEKKGRGPGNERTNKLGKDTGAHHSSDSGAPGSGKSTKGDGNLETAKNHGTVDPNAPVK